MCRRTYIKMWREMSFRLLFFIIQTIFLNLTGKIHNAHDDLIKFIFNSFYLFRVAFFFFFVCLLLRVIFNWITQLSKNSLWAFMVQFSVTPTHPTAAHMNKYFAKNYIFFFCRRFFFFYFRNEFKIIFCRVVALTFYVY